MDRRSYQYSKTFLLNLVGMLTVLPSIALVFICSSFGVTPSTHEDPLVLALISPVLLMAIAPPAWYILIINTKINIDEHGINIRKLTKQLHINWKDIESIKRVAIFSGTFPSYGPPQDLEISLANKKKINIYHFITTDEDGDNPIDELEAVIAENIQKTSNQDPEKGGA